jgi:subtilisin family serine protease
LLLLTAVSTAAAPLDKLHPALAEIDGDILTAIIIEYDQSAMPDRAYLEQMGCATGRELRALHGIAAECPASVLEEISYDEAVAYVWEDRILEFALDGTKEIINATAAWESFGNGTGINVSILDTGINTTHPALSGQVILQEDFTGENDTIYQYTDRCDHGTPIACIVGCTNDTYTGIAPGAKLFNAKIGAVINPNPLQCGAFESDIIAAIDWSIEHRAHVLQMSVGGATSGCYQNALAVAINRTAQNITIVIAAGNGGPGTGTIWMPGCAENAVTVGATNQFGDGVTFFSSRGPTDYGLNKPDLVAPGSQIQAASNDGVTYAFYQGTSFASPYVAGVVALMLQQRRLRPWEVKHILNTTSTDLEDIINVQGAGLVDAWDAVNKTLSIGQTVILNISQLFRKEGVTEPPFLINATVRNEGNTQANDTSVRVSLPDGIELVSSPEIIDTAMIPGLEQKKASWFITANATGNYTITIIANSSNAADANASIVVEFLLGEPSLVTTAGVSSGNNVAAPFIINATILNNGTADAANVTVTLELPAKLAILSSAAQNIATLAPAEAVVLNWTLNASKSGNYSANLTTSADNFAPNLTVFAVPVDLTAFGAVIELNNATGRDTYIRSSSGQQGLNWGASPLLRVDASPNYRTLLYWDLGSIPAEATITNATMTLFVNSVMSTASNTIRAFRVTQDWTEGTGNGQDTDNGATWLTYNGTASWASPGGDYNTTIWASQAVTTANKFYAWNLTGLVAHWIKNNNNKGLLLNATGSSGKDFSSSDSTNSTRRPRLQINYTL